MRAPWHLLLGSGRGPLTRLAPQTRIMCSGSVLAACLIMPATTAAGSAVLAVTVLGWLWVCGPPAATIRAVVMLGMVTIGPVFLLTPWLGTTPGEADVWPAAAAAPWAIFARGLACMLVTVAGASTLSATALRQGLVALPVPRILILIVLQVVQQTSMLIHETGRVAAAMAVRGGDLGTRAAARMLTTLPTTWLPRVMTRADRVADAMELRGPGDVELAAMGTARLTTADVAAVLAAAAVVVGAVALRLGAAG